MWRVEGREGEEVTGSVVQTTEEEVTSTDDGQVHLLPSPSSSLLCQVIESRVVLLPPPSLPSFQITCSVAGTPPGHAVLDTKHLLVLCKLLAQHQRVSDLLPPQLDPAN